MYDEQDKGLHHSATFYHPVNKTVARKELSVVKMSPFPTTESLYRFLLYKINMTQSQTIQS